MTHAPKFWAAKLPPEHRGFFWSLVNWDGLGGRGFNGETAYCRTVAFYNLRKAP